MTFSYALFQEDLRFSPFCFKNSTFIQLQAYVLTQHTLTESLT